MLLAITLIGAAENPLTETHVVTARDMLESGGFQVNGQEWLCPDEACDIFAEGDVERARSSLSAWADTQKLDIIAQLYENRRKKAFLADMESTIIQQEMLDELAVRAGIRDSVAETTLRAMNGEIDFKEALKERLALLAGADAQIVYNLLNEIRLTPGAKELVATLKKQGCRTILVSSGFTIFTDAVARKLKFDEHYGNILHIQDNKILGQPVDPVLGREAKLERLKTTAQQMHITPEQICAVGDGANDLPMILAAGLGVAYHAKPALRQKATHKINFASLRALIWAQGYRKEDLAA